MKTSYDFTAARRGSVVESKGKTRITIWIDDDVLASFRARAQSEGRGYQTAINDVLRAATLEDAPLTSRILRQILREELHPA
jgi:uncharacterized protein (DUF4415 family)